ncbi:PAS domain-containing protein [Phaeovulum sp. W22_SRMD_FR3]
MPSEKIRSIFRRSPIALSLVDLQAADQPLILINAAFTALTGYEASEIIGRNCRFLGRPDENFNSRAELRAATHAGQEVQVVLRNYRKDGSRFDNLLILHPVGGSGPGTPHMLGTQFAMRQSPDVTGRAERHLSLFLTALDEMDQRAERLIMSQRRQIAETTAQLLRGWSPKP